MRFNRALEQCIWCAEKGAPYAVLTAAQHAMGVLRKLNCSLPAGDGGESVACRAVTEHRGRASGAGLGVWARHVGAHELVPWKRTDEDGMTTDEDGLQGDSGDVSAAGPGPEFEGLRSHVIRAGPLELGPCENHGRIAFWGPDNGTVSCPQNEDWSSKTKPSIR